MYCTVHTDTGSNITSYSYFFVLAKLCIYYQLYYHLQGPVREVEIQRVPGTPESDTPQKHDTLKVKLVVFIQ